MRIRIRGALAALPLALALALTGCGAEGGGDGVASAVDGSNEGSSGGSGDGAEGDGASAADMDFDEMMLAFAECLRENGVQVEDPEPGQGVDLNMDGQDENTVEAAMTSCREFDPAENGGNEPLDPEIQAKIEDYADCMRDEGVDDFPDPEPNGGIALDGAVMEDPDYEAAEETCQDILPAGDGEQSLEERE